jgi:PII-like signaling protein
MFRSANASIDAQALIADLPGTRMRTESQAHLLRIFVNESDRYEGRAVYETIIRLAKEQGLAGATALRAIEGYGANSRVHSVKVLHLSEDVPIVVEIIDAPERIAAFIPTLDKIVAEGVVTVEKIHVLTYRRNGGALPIGDDEIRLDISDSELEAELPVFEVPAYFGTATERARKIVESAQHSAAHSRRVFIDSVDVLLAMIAEQAGVAGNVLRHVGVDSAAVERSLRESVARDEPSNAFIRALDTKSIAAAKWLGHNYPGTEHLLIALCQIRPSAATDTLMRLGAQPRDICQEVLAVFGRHDDWQRWLADHPDM